jgi:hypothetical protein
MVSYCCCYSNTRVSYCQSRSLVDRILYGEPCPYWVELIQCHSDHGEYECSHGGVAISGGDGTCSSTQVPVAKCTLEPVVACCLV